MKVKLLPSLREKKRYLAFEVDSKAKISKENMVNEVQRACRRFMGEYNYANAGVLVLKDNINGNKGILKVNSKYVDHVKSSLILVNKINNERVIFKNIKVSGTLLKVK